MTEGNHEAPTIKQEPINKLESVEEEKRRDTQASGNSDSGEDPKRNVSAKPKKAFNPKQTQHHESPDKKEDNARQYRMGSLADQVRAK